MPQNSIWWDTSNNYGDGESGYTASEFRLERTKMMGDRAVSYEESNSDRLNMTPSGNGSNVVISEGYAWFDGYFYINTSNATLSVPSNPSATSHAVVLRIVDTASSEHVRLYIKSSNSGTTTDVQEDSNEWILWRFNRSSGAIGSVRDERSYGKQQQLAMPFSTALKNKLEKLVLPTVVSRSSSFFVIPSTDIGKTIRYTGTANGVLFLPDIRGDIGVGDIITILNDTSNTLTATGNGNDTVDGEATIVLQGGDAITLQIVSSTAWSVIANTFGSADSGGSGDTVAAGTGITITGTDTKTIAVTNPFTDTDETKLDGVADGANNVAAGTGINVGKSNGVAVVSLSGEELTTVLKQKLDDVVLPSVVNQTSDYSIKDSDMEKTMRYTGSNAATFTLPNIDGTDIQVGNTVSILNNGNDNVTIDGNGTDLINGLTNFVLPETEAVRLQAITSSTWAIISSTIEGAAATGGEYVDAGTGVSISGAGTSADPKVIAVTEPYTAAERTKLATVEDNATADQTGSEIKTAYEAQSNTNAFTDALQTKLNAVVLPGVNEQSNNYTVLNSDLGKTVRITGTNAVTVSLPDITGTVGVGDMLAIINETNQNTTIDPNGSDTINGESTYTLPENEAILLQIVTTSSWFIVATTVAGGGDTVVAGTGVTVTGTDTKTISVTNPFEQSDENKLDAIADNATRSAAGTGISIATASGVDTISLSGEQFTSALRTKLDNIVLPSIINQSGGYTINTDDMGKTVRYAGSNNITFTLPDITGTVGIGDEIVVLNDGTGVLTVDGNGSDTINGEQTQAIAAGNAYKLQIVGNTAWSIVASTGAGGGDTVAAGTGISISGSDTKTISLSGEEYTSTEKTKLAGVENNATADQTGAEIKTAYESQSDTNAFTDSEKTKVGNLVLPSVSNQSSGYVIQSGDMGTTIRYTGANDVTFSLPNITGTVEVGDEIAILNDGTGDITIDGNSSDTINGETTFVLESGNALRLQIVGNTAWSIVASTIDNIGDTVAAGTGISISGSDTKTISLSGEEYTSTEKTKLAGVEDNATADQTGAEIKTAYESQSDTNAFTDAFQTKLNNIVLPEINNKTGSYTLTSADLGKSVRLHGSNAATFTLPDITGDVSVGSVVVLLNDSTQTLTVRGNGTDTINSNTTFNVTTRNAIKVQVVGTTEWSLIGSTIDNVGSGGTSDGWVTQPNAPSSPVQGTGWYDSTTDELKIYDGSSFVVIGSSGGTPNPVTATTEDLRVATPGTTLEVTSLGLAGDYSGAHNLNSEPHYVDFYYECVTASQGWAVGDKIVAEESSRATLGYDSTNLYMAIPPNSGSQFRIAAKDGNTDGVVTLTHWKAVAVPYIYEVKTIVTEVTGGGGEKGDQGDPGDPGDTVEAGTGITITGTNPKTIFVTNPFTDADETKLDAINLPGIVSQTGNYTIVATDMGKTIRLHNTPASRTFTLPDITGTVNAGDKVYILNDSDQTLNLQANGSDTIDGETSIEIVAGAAMSVQAITSDTWQSLGNTFGTAVDDGDDDTNEYLPGINNRTANYTITAADKGKTIRLSSGTNVTFILPDIAGDVVVGDYFYVMNSTANNLSVDAFTDTIEGSTNNYIITAGNVAQFQAVTSSAWEVLSSTVTGDTVSAGTGISITGAGTLPDPKVIAVSNPFTNADETKLDALKLPGIVSQTGNYTILATNLGKTIRLHNTNTTRTFTLPQITGNVGPGDYLYILNDSDQTLVLEASTLNTPDDTIDGEASIDVNAGDALAIQVITGGSWQTIANTFGTAEVTTQPGGYAPGINNRSANYTIVAADVGKTVRLTTGSNVRFTLPDIAGDVDVGDYIYIMNSSSNSLIVDANGTDTINTSSDDYTITAGNVAQFQAVTSSNWNVLSSTFAASGDTVAEGAGISISGAGTSSDPKLIAVSNPFTTADETKLDALKVSGVSFQTADYTITTADMGKTIIQSTSGTTVVLPNIDGTNVSVGDYVDILNGSNANITLDANGTDTINGATTWTISAARSVTVQASTTSTWLIISTNAGDIAEGTGITLTGSGAGARTIAVTNPFSNTEKTKLAGIADNANSVTGANGITVAKSAGAATISLTDERFSTASKAKVDSLFRSFIEVTGDYTATKADFGKAIILTGDDQESYVDLPEVGSADTGSTMVFINNTTNDNRFIYINPEGSSEVDGETLYPVAMGETVYVKSLSNGEWTVVLEQEEDSGGGDTIAAGTGVTITGTDTKTIAVTNPFTDADETKLDSVATDANNVVGGTGITVTKDSNKNATIAIADQIFTSALKTKLDNLVIPAIENKDSDYSLVASDMGKTIRSVATSAITFTLPDITGDVEIGNEVVILNNSTEKLTVRGNGTDTINGNATYSVDTHKSIHLQAITGSSWNTVGDTGDIVRQGTGITVTGTDTKTISVTNPFTDTDEAKLDAIADNATRSAAGTGISIATASGVDTISLADEQFTSALKTKLDTLDIPGINNQSGNYTVTAGDIGKTVRFTGSTERTFTLPDITGNIGVGNVITILNGSTSSNVIVDGNGNDTVDSQTTFTVYPRNSVTLQVTSTTSWNVIGIFSGRGTWVTQGSAPSNPYDGAGWYDNSNDELKIYNGSSWERVGDDRPLYPQYIAASEVAGTANAITLSTGNSLTSYAVNQMFIFAIETTNTGGVTVNVDSIGTRNLYATDGTTALRSGQMPDGALVGIIYDGSNFRLLFVSGLVTKAQVHSDIITKDNTTAPSRIWRGSQSDYDAIASPSNDVLYIIT